jgi:hypothetical protein
LQLVRTAEPSPSDAPVSTGADSRSAFLEKARTRFRTVVEAETAMRTEMLDDLRFRASDQWPADIQRQRQADSRPCLTINRLPQFIHQITNQQRENKPGVVVGPVDSDADVKTAEVFQGMVRHIERQSRAQVAYNTAGDSQATIGRGYLRILTQYESDTDFNQSLFIKRVRNPFSVYMDPACQELDYSDAEYAFVVTDLTEDQYDDKFGDIEPASLDDFTAIGNERLNWTSDKKIRVAEYWYVETAPDRLLQIETGDTINQSVVPPEDLLLDEKGLPAAILADGILVRVTKSRRTPRREVRWATISGIAVLDGNEDRTAGRVWLKRAKSIPIVPVIGDEIDINGVVDLRGIVRDAKHPQRRYNYMVSAETEALALVPKAPFVVADGQLEGYEALWAQANVKNLAYLPYKAMALDGHLVGAPQRQSASTDLSAIAASIAQADNDLKATTGFYEASLGQTGPEQSGKAILARQRQGDVGSFNYHDNMALAVATVGRYLVDVIPEVYDAPRITRILGEDGRAKSVMVHAGQPPAEPPPEGSGVEGVFDVGAGTYDVTASVGPSYLSRRTEAVAAITQFVQAFPPAFPMIGDLLAQHMDWPGAQAIAARLRKMLPPNLQDEGQDGQLTQADPPPEMVQQIQQMNTVIEKMTAELDQAKAALQGKQVESQAAIQIAQMSNESRERIAQLTADHALAKIHGQLAQKEMDLSDDVAIQVAGIETISREKVAQLNAATELAKTTQKIDGAIDLAAVKAQLDALAARLELATAGTTPSDKAGS